MPIFRRGPPKGGIEWMWGMKQSRMYNEIWMNPNLARGNKKRKSRFSDFSRFSDISTNISIYLGNDTR